MDGGEDASGLEHDTAAVAAAALADSCEADVVGKGGNNGEAATGVWGGRDELNCDGGASAAGGFIEYEEDGIWVVFPTGARGSGEEEEEQEEHGPAGLVGAEAAKEKIARVSSGSVAAASVLGEWDGEDPASENAPRPSLDSGKSLVLRQLQQSLMRTVTPSPPSVERDEYGYPPASTTADVAPDYEMEGPSGEAQGATAETAANEIDAVLREGQGGDEMTGRGFTVESEAFREAEAPVGAVSGSRWESSESTQSLQETAAGTVPSAVRTTTPLSRCLSRGVVVASSLAEVDAGQGPSAAAAGGDAFVTLQAVVDGGVGEGCGGVVASVEDGVVSGPDSMELSPFSCAGSPVTIDEASEGTKVISPAPASLEVPTAPAGEGGRSTRQEEAEDLVCLSGGGSGVAVEAAVAAAEAAAAGGASAACVDGGGLVETLGCLRDELAMAKQGTMRIGSVVETKAGDVGVVSFLIGLRFLFVCLFVLGVLWLGWQGRVVCASCTVSIFRVPQLMIAVIVDDGVFYVELCNRMTFVYYAGLLSTWHVCTIICGAFNIMMACLYYVEL